MVKRGSTFPLNRNLVENAEKLTTSPFLTWSKRQSPCRSQRLAYPPLGIGMRPLLNCFYVCCTCVYAWVVAVHISKHFVVCSGLYVLAVRRLHTRVVSVKIAQTTGERERKKAAQKVTQETHERLGRKYRKSERPKNEHNTSWGRNQEKLEEEK